MGYFSLDFYFKPLGSQKQNFFVLFAFNEK